MKLSKSVIKVFEDSSFIINYDYCSGTVSQPHQKAVAMWEHLTKEIIQLYVFDN